MIVFRDHTRRKLKAVITKKLEEMDIDVEKELPDYILSIITNRKDKDYMKKSLSVFMGNKAGEFTEWVFTITSMVEDSQKTILDNKAGHSSRVEHNNHIEDAVRSRKRRSEIGENDSDIHTKRGDLALTDKDRDKHKKSDNKKMAPDVTPPAPKVASSVVRLVNPFDDIPSIASKVVVPVHPRPQVRTHSSIFQKAVADMSNALPEKKPQNPVYVELEESPAPERYVTVRVELETDRNKHEVRRVISTSCETVSVQTEKENYAKTSVKHDTTKRELEPLTVSCFLMPKKSSVSEEPKIIEVTPIPHLDISCSSHHEKSQHMNVRCKYWPECGNQNCTYIHPNKSCQNFPKCVYGNECLYVHPPCRYAKECKNEYCTYTHGSKESLQKVVEMLELPPSELKRVDCASQPHLCYFGGNCTNKTCKYKHPPDCTFGERCLKYKTCQFYHGPLRKAESKRSSYYWQSST